MSTLKSQYQQHLDKLRQSGGDKLVEDYKSAEAIRQKIRRINATAKEKEVQKNQSRIRQKRYHSKRKNEQLNVVPKRLTRKEQQQEQERLASKKKYWREAKQKSRRRLKMCELEDEKAIQEGAADESMRTSEDEGAGPSQLDQVSKYIPQASSTPEDDVCQSSANAYPTKSARRQAVRRASRCMPKEPDKWIEVCLRCSTCTCQDFY